MTNSKRLSPITPAPLNITTLLLLMGCAGIGRTGKPDSVTFDAETVSLPAFDENTTVLSGTIVHEPTVEIDAREAVFSIRDAGALEGVLDIDPQTGVVTVTQDLTPDHEVQSEFEFTIVASFGNKESTQTVKVFVNDLNDVAPIFNALSPQAVSVNEDGELVIPEHTNFAEAVTAIADVDGATVPYAIESGEDSNLLQIDENGILSLYDEEGIDWETDVDNREFTVNVIATVGDLSTTIGVSFVVQNVNDVPPTITSSATENALIENTLYDTDAVIYRAEGDYDLEPIIWSLTGADAALFTIDAATGEVRFTSDTTPDHEAKSSYSFTIVATSGDLTADSQDVTMAVTDLNDVDPVITSSATADALIDNTAYDTSHVVYTATGTFDDAVSGIVWSLTGTDAALFDIDSATGAVTFKTDTTIDETSHTDFDFTLVATSGNLPAVEKAVTITVKDAVIPIPDTSLDDENPDEANTITGTTAAELIQGGRSRDAISTGGGGDTVIGGYGFDTVTLGAGNDTVVMRFNSDSNSLGTWRMDDGGDVIHNFKRGEDKLVFVDMVDKTGASPITSFSQWLADDNRPEVSLVYDTSDIAQGNLGIKAVKLHFGSPGGSTGPNTGSNESSIVTINFDPTGTYYTLNATNIGTHTKNNSLLLSDTGLQVLDEILGGTNAFESFHVIDDSDLPSVLTIL